ncbi:cyclic AMP response element-binding protein B isoform X2 [Hermetia illucens]|uniref:cyclic AMP response element-binding protein B isoform X2 n=1 Tax=Hermetia illucens TaxID=343691 RepID=UPI0018CC2C77|nr:cyclic AMP response element-binding protein B isoform X2 [Hermetia illucens]
MDSIVEENGNSSLDPLNDSSGQQTVNDGGPQQNSTQTNTVLTTGANIVHFLPAPNIPANQSSVIQTANTHPGATLPKGGVVYLNKQNTVIHSAGGNTLQVHIKPEPQQQHTIDTNSEESLTDDDSPKRRRELTRRPSYHKILKEISGPDIAATTLQIANMNSGNDSGPGHTISGPGVGGTTVFQITTPGQEATFYVPALGPSPEDQSRKREIRLQKNREAARECRRKKKEYIKCLENRVAVLENQNKALIEELKALKELYCQQKND